MTIFCPLHEGCYRVDRRYGRRIVARQLSWAVLLPWGVYVARFEEKSHVKLCLEQYCYLVHDKEEREVRNPSSNESLREDLPGNREQLQNYSQRLVVTVLSEVTTSVSTVFLPQLNSLQSQIAVDRDTFERSRKRMSFWVRLGMV